MAKISVIGSGAWGTAMANVLSKTGNELTMWAYEKEVAEEINENHTNSMYLYGIPLEKSLKATVNLEESLKDAEYVFYATPSFALKGMLIKSSKFIKEDVIPVFLTKGFNKEKDDPIPKLPLEIADSVFPETMKEVGVYLAGPSHAEEVARDVYTGLIAASKNKKNAVKVRDIITNEYTSVYVSFDPTGVQVASALKNVVAIAFGLADAMSEYNKNIGDNSFALIIATGLNEIQLVGRALGATHPETFTSISSVGDLYVTCTSKHGRNRRFGRDIMQRQLYRRWSDFEDLTKKIDMIGYLPEGIFAVKHAMRIKDEFKLRLPIIEIVYQILNREIKPKKAVGMLMNVVNRT